MSSWYTLQQQRLQKPSPKAINNDDKDNDDEGGGGGVEGEASSSWSPQSSFLRRRSNSNSSSAKNRRQRIKGKKSSGGMPSEFDLLDDDNEKVLTEEELKKKRERQEQKKSWKERSAQKKREREAKWKDLKLAKQQQQKQKKKAANDEDDEEDEEDDAFCVEDTDDINNNKNKDSRAKDDDDDDDDDTDGTDGSDNVDAADAEEDSNSKKENQDDEDDDDKDNKKKDEKKKDKYEVDILKLAPGEEVKAPTCCRRYLSERNPCYEWYQIKDKLLGKRLDVQATFCPTSRRAKFFKLLATTSVVAGNVMNVMAYQDTYGSMDLGFFVYLDNVGMATSFAYMMLSMLNSVLGARQPWEAVEGRMRWVWLAFIVASHTQVMMSIMYWSLVYPGLGDDVGDTDTDADGAAAATSNAKTNAYNLSFLACMKYGGIAITVILDGMRVNRIPLRWMNWWGMLWFMNLFYIFFFAPLYSFFFCSALATPGASTALYPWLDWKGDWEFTLIVGVVFVFALSPAVFLTLWLMSLYAWPSCFCCKKESHRFLMSRAQRRKIKEAKLEAYNKKKEKEAQDNEELAFLQSDPKKLLPDTEKGESGISTEKNNTIGSLFNRNRRTRQDHDDETVMSSGSQSMAFQPAEDSRDRQDDVDLESQNDTQQRQEFPDDGTVASNSDEQEQEQAQPAATRAGWGRLGGLRTFLGSSMNNRNNKNRNNHNFDSSNDADSSISSMTESQYGCRSAIAHGDDPDVEDVALDEAKYPWDDVMGGLASDKKTTTATKDRSSAVVGNLSLLDIEDDSNNDLSLLDNVDDSDNNDDDLPDKQYKYPWDRDGSQGSLTYL